MGYEHKNVLFEESVFGLGAGGTLFVVTERKFGNAIRTLCFYHTLNILSIIYKYFICSALTTHFPKHTQLCKLLLIMS